jgi:YVTN family beta-propeller protein
VRIDPESNQIVATVDVGSQPEALAAGQDAVWVIDQGSQTVERIDPRTNTLVAVVGVGLLPSAIAIDGNSVWVISKTGRGATGAALSRIDGTDDTLTGNVDLGPGTPTDVAVGAGSIWVTMRGPDALVRVAPASRSTMGLLALLAVALVLAGCGAAWMLYSEIRTQRASPSRDRFEKLRRFAAGRESRGDGATRGSSAAGR